MQGFRLLATGFLFTKFHIEEILEKRLCQFPVFTIDAVLDLWCFNLALDQARVLQFLQMLTDSRLGNRQLFVNVPKVAGILLRQELHNGYPCRVSKSLGNSRQLFGFFTILFFFHIRHCS